MNTHHADAGLAVRNGMSRDGALRALTLNGARMLDLEHRTGSLERGKDADLALFDGDPFEYTTHVCAVVIDGAVVSETCR